MVPVVQIGVVSSEQVEAEAGLGGIQARLRRGVAQMVYASLDWALH